MFRAIFNGFIEGIVYSLVITVIISLAFMYLPEIEFKFKPVLTDVHLTLIKQENEFRVYDISFKKVESCDPDPGSMSWYIINKDDQYEKVLIEPPVRTGDPSRPLGLNVSRNWRVMISKNTVVKAQKLVFYHFCHPGWRSKTEILIK